MIVLKASAAELNLPPTLIDSIVDQEHSGKGAVWQVEGNQKNYKLIITDLSMPMMDGYETAIKIRQYIASQGLTQPVIVACTGHTEQEFIEKAWRSEFNEILSKPINLQVAKEILAETVV